jgi:hypothetical protein
MNTIEELRRFYPAPTERLVKKQLSALDSHCRRFISLSPFVVIASAARNYSADASPRGGAPGFVKVLDDRTLLIPDAPGNNRIDTFQNIVDTGHVGLLFLIPGIDETLRVNGTAQLSTCETLMTLFAEEKRRPMLLIKVTAEEVFLHCPKALMRSRLWDQLAHAERSVMPTVIEMINDQTGITLPVKTHEETRADFAKDL